MYGIFGIESIYIIPLAMSGTTSVAQDKLYCVKVYVFYRTHTTISLHLEESRRSQGGMSLEHLLLTIRESHDSLMKYDHKFVLYPSVWADQCVLYLNYQLVDI